MTRYKMLLPIRGKENEFLELESYYDRGELEGIGHRGYWLSYMRIKKKKSEWGESIEHDLVNAKRFFIMPLKRNSKSAFEKSKAKLFEVKDRMVQLSGFEVENKIAEEEEY